MFRRTVQAVVVAGAAEEYFCIVKQGIPLYAAKNFQDVVERHVHGEL